MRSYFQNSCFVFHRGIQTPRTFICFSVFGYPDETLALVLEIVRPRESGSERNIVCIVVTHLSTIVSQNPSKLSKVELIHT